MFQIKHLRKEISNPRSCLPPRSNNISKANSTSVEQNIFHWSHYNDKLQGTLIYTDGSKMINRVGGAFVAYQSNVEVHHPMLELNNEATVYMAEIQPLIRPLNAALPRAYHPQISSPTLDQCCLR
ncbi:hypothetical protein CEXT_658851 [Caerostris extrusa]|uniref:RNase H type-1 domain-containing protein n=1 Tax=Caerostris extrusa TaxID=172846 RepID=A0AAV4NJF4_CAEEX|nr:hypothetical protein CEXT_658851 [Caerostris extrusa]